MNLPRRPLSALLLSGLLLLIPNAPAQAGSATWNLNPTSGNWNKAANWTPATVPNGPADVATFSISNQTSVVLNESAELNQIVFGAGASPFTITCEPFAHFNMTGTGMINNSGINQTFVTTVIEGQRLGVGTSIFSTAPARG